MTVMIGTTAGLLTVCITEQPTHEVIAEASERFDIVRASTMSTLEAALERSQSPRILIEGLLDTLYDPHMLTREAAHALGRLKLRLEALAESGVEVVVLCEVRRNDLGTRSHFLHSLCASADRVVTDLSAA